MIVKVEKIFSNVVLPVYQTSGSAGCDLHCYILSQKPIEIEPGETKLLQTGLKFEIPHGFELQIRPRSGLSLKTKLRVANAPGTIDSDYRGEVAVIMTNTGKETVTINHGDRIAQAVLSPVYQMEFVECDDLLETERGNGGFGSTGA